ASVVAEQLGVLPVVRDEEIEIAVVVEVTDGEAAADTLGRECRAGVPADLDEVPPRRVAKEQLALHVGRPGTKKRRVVEDVAVRNGDVELSVVVLVEERDAKADERQRRETDAALCCRIGE